MHDWLNLAFVTSMKKKEINKVIKRIDTNKWKIKETKKPLGDTISITN